jgi:Zn-dependent peptidase ImmA (M78 family)
MSYQKFADINHCSVSDVIALCQSKSGCTHYDVETNRYLILVNLAETSNYGRRRWTIAHEIGHIVCRHHILSAVDKIAENTFAQINNQDYEIEADYFAVTLLSPLPLFKAFEIQSARDIQNTFGLSAEASDIRLKEYKIWLRNHRKTAWENDIVNMYKRKSA